MSVILDEVFEYKGPSFIRITKGDYNEPIEIVSPSHFIVEGESPVALVSHGKMVKNCVEAALRLGDVSVCAIDRIKPLDDRILEQICQRFEHLIVVEDNFQSGLFNSICQWVVEYEEREIRIGSINPPEQYEKNIGSAEFLEEMHGLTAEKIFSYLSKRVLTTPFAP